MKNCTSLSRIKLIGIVVIFFNIILPSKIFAQSDLIELLCEGGFTGESDRKEFQLSIGQDTGFMWGFDPVFIVGFLNLDDKRKPFSENFKCGKQESAYFCSGGNSIGYSHAELSRYTGVLRITTALKNNNNNLFKSEFKCDKPPAKKF